MSWDCRQSPLKTLLNTLGAHHKTHIMTRYENHNMEDVPVPQDSAPPDLAPPDHTMPRGDNESSDEYSEDNDTCHPLAELLEQFKQLWDQFVSLKSASQPPTHTVELIQLTDKLQHLTMTLQPHPPPILMRNPCTTLCRHTLTPCEQHRERQTSPWPCCRISSCSMDKIPQSQ